MIWDEENFKNTNDTHLVATYFQFGRYLLICSSQPGGQPANLQGIWNDKLFPSWDSKYTCNINLEMNYWPSEVTNLSELNEPLFRLIKEVSDTGKETAKIMYGANGWVLHHNTDIMKAHDVIDRLERKIQSKYNCVVTIHMDPIAVSDEYTIELKEKISESLADIDGALSLHDFRIVKAIGQRVSRKELNIYSQKASEIGFLRRFLGLFCVTVKFRANSRPGPQ